MRTTVYVKMDAHDQLLLSEGVCRQLGIISYHDKVEKWRGGSKQLTRCKKTTAVAKVPTVKVKLVKAIRLLPHQSVIATVQCDTSNKPLLMELKGDGLLQPEDVLLAPSINGQANVVINNSSGCSCVIAGGTCIGEAVEVEPILPGEANSEKLEELEMDVSYPSVRRIPPTLGAEERKRVLRELVPRPVSLDGERLQKFNKFLESPHEAFSLEPQERGETHLVEMEISTGNAEPVNAICNTV